MMYLSIQLVSLTEEAISLVNDYYVRTCGLSVRELRVLRCIDDNPSITPGKVVELAYMEKSLISRILNLLIKQGLVRRTVSVEDARQFNLASTAKGRKLRAHADEVGAILESVMLTPLDNRERESLAGSLDKLSAWVKGGGMAAELDKQMRSVTAGDAGGPDASQPKPGRARRSRAVE